MTASAGVAAGGRATLAVRPARWILREKCAMAFEDARNPFQAFYFGFEESAEKFRRGVSAPLVPPSPFRWAVAPLARSCERSPCAPVPFSVGRRSPRARSCERSCPLSLDRLSDIIFFVVYGLAIDPEHGIRRGDCVDDGLAIDPEHGSRHGFRRDCVDGC